LSYIADSQGRPVNGILLRLLTALEDIKETQRVQNSMLQSIMRRMKEKHEQAELPEGLLLPLRTMEELDAFEEKAEDKAFCNAVVSFSFVICVLHKVCDNFIQNLLPPF
jgi:hypothetical protein